LPRLDDHFQQARENRRLVEKLVEAFPDDGGISTWAMTIAFYAAVHWIEGHFARSGIHSRSHAESDSRLIDVHFGIPNRVVDTYRRMQVWSENGRYQLQTFSADAVRARGLSSLAVITTFVLLDT
jgi:hypothetical protein